MSLEIEATSIPVMQKLEERDKKIQRKSLTKK